MTSEERNKAIAFMDNLRDIMCDDNEAYRAIQSAIIALNAMEPHDPPVPDRKVRCHECRHCFPRFTFGEDRLVYICTEDKTDLSGVDPDKIEEHEVECDTFRNKYIVFPIEVHSVEISGRCGLSNPLGHETGTLVKIRPCGKEYEGKTYLGFLIGDISIHTSYSYNSAKKQLGFYGAGNPAIFVPALRKVIFGCESWWCVIENEDELKDITGEDIENVWYVQLLKAMHTAGNSKPEKADDKASVQES